MFDELANLRKIFEQKYEHWEDEQPLFKKSLEFYLSKMTDDSREVLQRLADEIQEVKREAEQIQALTDIEMARILFRHINYLPAQIILDSEKHYQRLETSIKSLRKTPCWGRETYALDFEYPTAHQLLQMLKKTLNIKVAELKYKNKVSEGYPSYFGGIQLILSNKEKSPVFLAMGQCETNLQTFDIADYSVIKSIKGSVLNHDGYPLHKLCFGKRDGSETKVERS